jgi:hypothetical protein
MVQSTFSRTNLDLQQAFEALRGPLELIENPERRAEIERYLAVARTYQEMAIFNVLSEMVQTINAAGGMGRVRLEYGENKLNLVMDADESAEQDAMLSFGRDEGVERVTIRMPASLKRLADQAANTRGTSLNNWYVRTVARAIEHHTRSHHGEQEHEPTRGRQGRRGGPRPM